MQESKEESNTSAVNAKLAIAEWITVGVSADRHQTTEIALTDVQVWAYTVALWFDIQTNSTLPSRAVQRSYFREWDGFVYRNKRESFLVHTQIFCNQT